MPTPEQYDVVVLGSGEAGKYIAWTQAKKGKQAVVIERRYIGGSCPNIACLPSKNIIHSAKVASYFARSEEFGITKDNWQIHMTGVRDSKRKMVEGLVDMHLANFKSSGAELLLGSGRFIAPKTIEVSLPDDGSRFLHGENIIISTGSRATIEPIPGWQRPGALAELWRTPRGKGSFSGSSRPVTFLTFRGLNRSYVPSIQTPSGVTTRIRR